MHNNNAEKNLDMIRIMDMLEPELVSRGRQEDFNFFLINHVLLDTISRLANQDDPGRKAVIAKVRAYVHEKLPNLTRCKSYKAESRRRRIIMYLNYHGLEDLGQWMLRVKNRM